jgi:hypothetical protein
MADVTARGRALYEYDQAAWHATDAVRALHPPDQLVGRYLALKSDNGWTVVFGHLYVRRDRFLIGYEASEGATLQEFTVINSIPLRKTQLSTLRLPRPSTLRGTTFKVKSGHTTLPFSLPIESALCLRDPSPDEDWDLPTWRRCPLSHNGGRQGYCGEMSTPQRDSRGSAEFHTEGCSIPAGGIHTHILSDVPEDTDVFHVLTRQPPRPEFIGTPNKKFYEISVDGTIRERKM